MDKLLRQFSALGKASSTRTVVPLLLPAWLNMHHLIVFPISAVPSSGNRASGHCVRKLARSSKWGGFRGAGIDGAYGCGLRKALGVHGQTIRGGVQVP